MSSKTKTTATTEEAKPARVPKLRFPEFRKSEGWKETPLVDVLSPVLREQKKPSGAYTGLGLRSHGKGTFLKMLADPDKNSMEYLYEVKRDDLVVNITFAWEGAVAIAQASDDGALVSHRFPTYTFEKGKATPAFFRYVILDKLFVYKLGVISPGGAGRNRVLSKNDFLKLTVLLPKPAEQQKIAECLSSVDELMATQARKVDALKTHKKGLMQQLFPTEGETQPRLRFPEFQNAGEWCSKPLGELGEIITGKTPSTKVVGLWGGDILFITPTDISEDRKYQHTAARTVVETKSTKVLPEGSIVYTCIASIGKMALTVSPSITNQQINAVVPHKRALGEFLYYVLANLTPWIKTIPATNTLPIINKTDFSKIAILHPEDKDEQQRIAACLSSLDTLITAETQKLEALKTHKKGLMQQLFPAPAAVA